MDLLADVLRVAGVRGTVAATVHAGDPWGLRLFRISAAAFHAVTAGTAWLRLPGQPPLRLMPGDVVLLPTGSEHGLAGDADGPLEPFDHAASKASLATDGRLDVGTQPARTRILCASYRHDPAVTTPLFTLLPEVVHVPAGTPGAGPLADTLRLLSGELAEPGPATTTLLDRLVDVLLIQVLRAWLRAEPTTPSISWLRALNDPTIGAALTALHADPGRAWTLASLARHVAVSRATLARRFPALVGETPAAYLTRWRMDLAARRLRDTDDPIEVIAHAVGYTSEYAFSRAFSRDRAIPPGRYRAQSRTRHAAPAQPPAAPFT
ncbi:AraC family transcriptional regulator [Frankia sp. CNm7]|uniref:AraC family transcriptional regulator n=1 Tax=Frankia nepalensis TaxID=1836974 RepID=A0A937UPD5_9ACTN|nr:AraC family transcriptional regulator [Frankia nepalensis]MBL7498959.1 AraC family transcriptional regulator [Frankia nepalensis]MBL7511244.1 AraC family transcriptional regulator [Frankia nepalensis]MBL7520582.1 AraC family transcriptional regulator [Frankia nepalensis]MBL7630764.1 AraC family transcriptional regulator [Frankia nepalensis]